VPPCRQHPQHLLPVPALHVLLQAQVNLMREAAGVHVLLVLHGLHPGRPHAPLQTPACDACCCRQAAILSSLLL
jgi:hypothetical protein